MRQSKDIWFNAFLLSKGHNPAKYEVDPRHRVNCHYDIPDLEWRELKLEFNNSEIIKFKGLVERIKDLGF